MPARFGTRSPRAGGPQPFSSEWLAADAPPAEPARGPVQLPQWLPDGRALNAALVVAICLVVVLIGFQSRDRGARVEQNPLNGSAAELMAEPVVNESSQPTEELLQSAAPPLITPEVVSVELAAATAPEFAQTAEEGAGAAAQVATAPADGPLLPEYRIVAYYGHPHESAMGIVGEFGMEELAAKLRTEAENYAAADPSRPVIPAFEIIATVAQRVPGSDGTYILDTDHETLTTYIDYAETQGMLVILDVQIGRGTIANEIEKVRDLLARPNVHLAIDPEFAVAEGQIPGEYIGSVAAESITYAQQVLAEIAATNGVPPKMLIVHQFREDMIQNKEQLAPYPGVQLVIDADGYGAPELKTAVFNFLVRDEPIEFGGVKLFYRQDVPMMSPQDILALVPAPDVIIYQ
ncbi:MAG: hypothetical protein H0T18_01375 [Chloroflexia bacterium]|nr:hypothetical protein [Chloroflexia bacterium]